MYHIFIAVAILFCKKFCQILAAYTRQLHAYGDIFPFDGFDYPDVVECAPHKFAISARNRYMALNADFIIAYVCCDYGGAYETVRAARNHDKPVIEIKIPADWAGCNIL